MLHTAFLALTFDLPFTFFVLWPDQFLFHCHGPASLVEHASQEVQTPGLCLSFRFSIWLIRKILKAFVYTPSTPCRDVKFSRNIPHGSDDLS